MHQTCKSPRLARQSTSRYVSSALLVMGLSAGLAIHSPSLYAQESASVPARKAYNIPAAPLGSALADFASQAGVTIQIDSLVVEGRKSAGLNGSFSVQEGFARLLDGSGLLAVEHSPKIWVLRHVPVESTLPVVTVREGRPDSSAGLQQEGKAADGYRARTISSLGALGSVSLVDAPFAISVVPQELMQNIHAQSPDDVYKINPSTLSQVPQSSGWAPMVKIRGFNSYDRAEDGLRRSFSMAASLEDKERVEVLNGLSGFLFGAASPGGMVNYVSKRPTQERLNSVTVGNYGGSQYYVHGDFGGQFDSEGRVGYRLNLVRQSGETAVDDQKIDRTLASLALDVKVTDRLKLELGAAYSDYKMQAPTAYWTFREGVPRIKAPDSSKNWGQPWIQEETESRKLSAKAIFEANENLTFRMAYQRDDQDRPQQDHTMNSVRSPTEYYQIRIHSGPTRTESEAWQALADLTFDTGAVAHKVTAGYYGFADKQWQTSYAPNTGWLGPYSIASPTHVAEPAWPLMPANALYFSSRVRNDNWMIGDMMQFNQNWSLLVGINRSTIKVIERESDGSASQPDYNRSRVSPNVSLIYKPATGVTTYATYIEGLEQGGVAGTSTSNPLAVMPPMVSKQKEIGVKWEIGNVLLSGALFDIAKAYEYTDASNTYTQDGRQRHRGGEISATGKLTSAWTLVGGLTMLTARVEGGDNNGKSPMNVPKVVAKLYSEYALPFAAGWNLTGGVYHVGKQWATATNTSRLPSYTVADIGLRYTTNVRGRPLNLRLTVNNVTDRDYWLNSYYLGTPRSMAFSAQTSF